MRKDGKEPNFGGIEHETWRTVLDNPGGSDATLAEVAQEIEAVAGAEHSEAILNVGGAEDAVVVLKKSNNRFLVTGSEYDLERVADEIGVHDSAEQVSRYLGDDPHIETVSMWEVPGGADQ